jgi:hypothetical protein
VNLSVTIVPVCTGSNAKTFGLQHVQFLGMGESGGLSNRTCIVRPGTDELIIQQNTIPDGETLSPRRVTLAYIALSHFPNVRLSARQRHPSLSFELK